MTKGAMRGRAGGSGGRSGRGGAPRGQKASVHHCHIYNTKMSVNTTYQTNFSNMSTASTVIVGSEENGTEGAKMAEPPVKKEKALQRRVRERQVNYYLRPTTSA
ncbi:hypothetical protein PT974_07518 [Cladobotryum mycophilum]|uniref:Uncharacterized protein n=1 Tax=Cladobotryum mycophilum TaxID=491253 RepID=A0ABR0SPH0_9HYPO